MSSVEVGTLAIPQVANSLMTPNSILSTPSKKSSSFVPIQDISPYTTPFWGNLVSKSLAANVLSEVGHWTASEGGKLFVRKWSHKIPAARPSLTVFIAHGMCEHSERYAELAHQIVNELGTLLTKYFNNLLKRLYRVLPRSQGPWLYKSINKTSRENFPVLINPSFWLQSVQT